MLPEEATRIANAEAPTRPGRWLRRYHRLTDRLDAVVIREASPEAVGALISIDPMAQAGDVARRAAIETWVSAGFTLVAESGANIVGYLATLPQHLLDRDFITILIVHPNHRRRGIGSSLLDAAVKRAAGKRVFTSTNTSNTPMKALLASSGWFHSGTLDGLDPGDPEEFYYIDRWPCSRPMTTAGHRGVGECSGMIPEDDARIERRDANLGDPPGCACVSGIWRSAGIRGRLKCTGSEPLRYAKDENVDQRLRESQPQDLPFMREMLHEAVFWRAGADMPSLAEGLVYPEVERSLENWGKRAGDTGVVATVDSTPVGASWYRLWTDDNYIRGYVNETTPVLVIGVRRDYRRRGVGEMLIDWLVDHASVQGIQRISLAVSKDNHALSLYRHLGFVEHVDMGDTLLMVRSLKP